MLLYYLQIENANAMQTSLNKPLPEFISKPPSQSRPQARMLKPITVFRTVGGESTTSIERNEHSIIYQKSIDELTE